MDNKAINSINFIYDFDRYNEECFLFSEDILTRNSEEKKKPYPFFLLVGSCHFTML